MTERRRVRKVDPSKKVGRGRKYIEKDEDRLFQDFPKVKEKPKKKKSKFATFLTLITLGVGAFLVYQVYISGYIDLEIAKWAGAAVALLPILFLLLHILCSNVIFCRILFSFLILCVGAAYGAGIFMVDQANKTLDVVTNLTNQKANKINCISLQKSGISSLEQLEGKTVGYSSILDSEGNEKELEHLQEQVHVQTKDYDNLDSLIKALLDEEVGAIVLNEVYRGAVQEMGDECNLINTRGNVLDQVKYFTKKKTKTVEPERVNITQEPFTVLVSGNDSYGTLEEVSRSDVNMLLTVNPNTGTVLITNISRDMYLPMACGADADANCLEGAMDKLTHSGLDGIATTEKTIEQMLDITINYNVRINFSSFENIVDAVGGIDVFVEEGCEVDSFYTNGTKGVKAGWNHLEGERALGFVRERYAYIDGTAQRVRNQQEAIKALIGKVCSLDTIKNFNNIIDALDSAFETNMSTDEIKSFIRYQFTKFPEWKFEGYSIRVEPSSEICYALQMPLAVDIPLSDSVQFAREKIQAVMEGKSADSIEDPFVEEAAGSYSSQDQAAIIQEGQKEKGTEEEPQQENVEENPPLEEVYTEEIYYEDVYYY